MIEITFIYESQQKILSNCKGNEKIKDIFQKNLGNQNNNKKLVFFYIKVIELMKN